MKILLQDGKTEIQHVNRVDERIDFVGQEVVKSLVVQVDMSVLGSITGDKAVEYYKTVGMERITVVDQNGVVVKTYQGFPTLASIYTTYSEKNKYLNLTFQEREQR